MSTLAGTLLTKLAGLSLAGKATVGVVIAVGAVGAVSAAPAVAQQFTGSSSAPVAVVSPSASSSASHTRNPHATGHPVPTELPSAAAFGQSVAADARDGGVDGQQISQLAHAKPGPTHPTHP